MITFVLEFEHSAPPQKKSLRCFFFCLARSQTLRKAIISFVISVCPSAWKKLGSYRTDFCEIWYLSIFRKSVEKNQFCSNLTRKTGTFHVDLCTFTSPWSLHTMRNVSDRIVKKVKTHVSCLITFSPRKSYRLWDNVEGYSTARQATDANLIWRMHIAC